MNNRKVKYGLQPYYVGREKRSLAVILPSRIVKEHNLDASTIFAIRATGDSKSEVKIILDVMDTKQYEGNNNEGHMTISAGNSFDSTSQQISEEVQ